VAFLLEQAHEVLLIAHEAAAQDAHDGLAAVGLVVVGCDVHKIARIVHIHAQDVKAIARATPGAG
jgi:hypothetical protein